MAISSNIIRKSHQEEGEAAKRLFGLPDNMPTNPQSESNLREKKMKKYLVVEIE